MRPIKSEELHDIVANKTEYLNYLKYDWKKLLMTSINRSIMDVALFGTDTSFQVYGLPDMTYTKMKAFCDEYYPYLRLKSTGISGSRLLFTLELPGYYLEVSDDNNESI